jgi:fluoride exporter
VTNPSDLAGPWRRSDLGAVALGGAFGTGLRMLWTAPLMLSVRGPEALRLLALNVLGALLLGVLLGARRSHRSWPFDLLGTGLLGGMTTFSSMVVAAGRLGHDAGLVVPGSSRMTGAGLTLAAGYLLLSMTLGLAAFRVGGRLSTRLDPLLRGRRSSPPRRVGRRTRRRRVLLAATLVGIVIGGASEAPGPALVVLLVLTAGALGASVRALVSARLPVHGTATVNLLGTLLLALTLAAHSSGALGPEPALVLGVGLCGALTTFAGWMALLDDDLRAGGRGRGLRLVLRDGFLPVAAAVAVTVVVFAVTGG